MLNRLAAARVCFAMALVAGAVSGCERDDGTPPPPSNPTTPPPQAPTPPPPAPITPPKATPVAPVIIVE